MRFCDIFDSYVDNRIKANPEANGAIQQFKRNIPGRILQIEFDGQRSNKQGVREGDKVYKLGLDLTSSAVFIEYYENFNQGQPSMAIVVDRANARVTVSGWQLHKRFVIRYSVENNAVKKTVNMA